MNAPFASMILVVNENSYHRVPGILECYSKQSYSHKELILINNARSHYSAVQLDIDSQLGLYLIDVPFKLIKGTAYNYGLSASRGQVIIPLYPNYWYGPEYVSEIVDSLPPDTLCYQQEIPYFNSHTNETFTVSPPNKIVMESMAFTRPVNVDYFNIECGFESGIFNRFKNRVSRVSNQLVQLLAGGPHSVDVGLSHSVVVGR